MASEQSGFYDGFGFGEWLRLVTKKPNQKQTPRSKQQDYNWYVRM